MKHPVNIKMHEGRSFGERASDNFTQAFGTWTYILIQTVIIIFWMAANVVGFIYHWDAYPFILLNLGFSAQASYAAPLILMAQNRASAVDRATLEHNKEETDKLLEMQETQTNILNAIKAETALLQDVQTLLMKKK